jgi:hypothetical protein
LPLDLQQTRLYARQIALPDVGPEGQERLAAAKVVVFRQDDDADNHRGGADDPAEIAACYLRAAGVGTVSVVPVPHAITSWQTALLDAKVALRFALDDDNLLPLAIETGVSLVLGRVDGDTIDLLAFRHHGGCAHRRPARPMGMAAGARHAGAAAAVLATLAATECLWMLIEPGRQPAARLLRLPLSGEAPSCDAIPWPPTCPLCAAATPGSAVRTRFS